MVHGTPVPIRVTGGSPTQSTFTVNSLDSSSWSQASRLADMIRDKQARLTRLGRWCSGDFGGFGEGVSCGGQRSPKSVDLGLMKLSVIVRIGGFR